MTGHQVPDRRPWATALRDRLVFGLEHPPATVVWLVLTVCAVGLLKIIGF